MKKFKFLLALVAVLGVLSFVGYSAHAAFINGQASADMQVSSATPSVGDNVGWTLTVTNTDSVDHVFNTRVSVIAQTSVYGCNPSELGAVFAKNQFAKVPAGQSVTFSSNLVAPAPDCVPGAAYRVNAVVLNGSDTVAIVGAPFTVGVSEQTVQAVPVSFGLGRK